MPTSEGLTCVVCLGSGLEQSQVAMHETDRIGPVCIECLVKLVNNAIYNGQINVKCEKEHPDELGT